MNQDDNSILSQFMIDCTMRQLSFRFLVCISETFEAPKAMKTPVASEFIGHRKTLLAIDSPSDFTYLRLHAGDRITRAYDFKAKKFII